MSFSFAIITPSYDKDFERCKLLVESIKKYVTQNVNHYIIVEEKDEQLFESLVDENINIILKEKILPKRIIRLPFTVKGRNIWFNFKGKILRGWIIQQIIKIGIANFIDEDVLVYMDSDEFFVKKVNFNESFVQNGMIRLFRETGRTEEKWDKTISKLLNVRPKNCRNVNYVEHPVTWRRKNVLEMQKYIEKISGKSWIDTISDNWHFSEYQLYGNFVDNILKSNSLHYHDNNKLSLKHEWANGIRPEKLNKNELKEFFSNISEQHISVMISSAANIPVKEYHEFFNNLNKS